MVTSMSICSLVNVVHSSTLVATRGAVLREGQARPRRVEREQVRLARAVRKHARIGQKHPGVGRVVAALRRNPGTAANGWRCG